MFLGPGVRVSIITGLLAMPGQCSTEFSSRLGLAARPPVQSRTKVGLRVLELTAIPASAA